MVVEPIVKEKKTDKDVKFMTVAQQQEQRRNILALYLQSRGHRVPTPVVKPVEEPREEVKESPPRQLRQFEQGDSPPFEARKKKKVTISVEMNDILPHDGSGEEDDKDQIRSLNNDLSHL